MVRSRLMIRRVFTVASVLSLLLGMAATSFFMRHVLSHPPGPRWLIRCAGYGLVVEGDELILADKGGYSVIDGGGMPLFPLAMILAIPPILYARSWMLRRKARRPDHSHCLICGYDLRASTVRCPECGTPIPSKSEATP